MAFALAFLLFFGGVTAAAVVSHVADERRYDRQRRRKRAEKHTYHAASLALSRKTEEMQLQTRLLSRAKKAAREHSALFEEEVEELTNSTMTLQAGMEEVKEIVGKQASKTDLFIVSLQQTLTLAEDVRTKYHSLLAEARELSRFALGELDRAFPPITSSQE